MSAHRRNSNLRPPASGYEPNERLSISDPLPDERSPLGRLQRFFPLRRLGLGFKHLGVNQFPRTKAEGVALIGQLVVRPQPLLHVGGVTDVYLLIRLRV